MKHKQLFSGGIMFSWVRVWPFLFAGAGTHDAVHASENFECAFSNELPDFHTQNDDMNWNDKFFQKFHGF